MSEVINVIVREGDSFDELYVSYEKPFGTAHDFTSSVLVADIKTRFSATTKVDSFGIVKLGTTGQIKLALTARQTERLARMIDIGYTERDFSSAIVSSFGEPGVNIAEFPDQLYPFLWDLKEFYYLDSANISTIVQGSDLDPSPEVSLFPMVITTTTPHNLTSEDSIRISGSSASVYNSTFANNQLVITSATQFYIVPLAGIPQWSQNATGGLIQVLKQDTICIGTLKVIPRISQQ